MVQIILPGPKFNFNGFYIEEFIGSPLGNNNGIHKFNLKDCGLFLNILNQNLIDNEDYEFNIKLVVFPNLEVILNLVNNNVEVLGCENELKNIGNISINLFCIKESFIIVSGSFKCQLLDYGWHFDDLINFNINIIIEEKRKKYFNMSIKQLKSKFPEKWEEIKFYNS
jgi:hypothetical protein